MTTNIINAVDVLERTSNRRKQMVGPLDILRKVAEDRRREKIREEELKREMERVYEEKPKELFDAVDLLIHPSTVNRINIRRLTDDELKSTLLVRDVKYASWGDFYRFYFKDGFTTKEGEQLLEPQLIKIRLNINSPTNFDYGFICYPLKRCRIREFLKKSTKPIYTRAKKDSFSEQRTDLQSFLESFIRYV